MTDLQNIIVMLGKSNETFEKMKSGKDWVIIVTGRGVEFYFNEDGNFIFLTTI